ncbi:alpha/beta hydrolase-like protein [Myriangium duriaei CBS 260.36]|uniref:Alpha/beta hydrolase-like protein n=1 Tax=Myriangium duriaei CBS 260.36 TaxID=1168546 RepID=A0A9P4IW02_9PEZI|nr:alpha/beta hydrolase-like protein [Myriangium duriaei CBS 260.36]
MPLTPAELEAHPEFPHIFWDLKPTKKGISRVASDRGGPHDIAWEVHGHGPVHIVWIMGLGAFKEAWQRQTKDFGHINGSTYSCLILDNRGIGQSSKPVTRYSTSDMAQDVYEILAHLQWNAKPRSVNVVGISMGGMIAQELAWLAPEMVASLNLISTAPRIVNTVGWVENLRNRINLFVPKSVERQIEMTKHNMYSEEWLDRPDETEAVVRPFPTNGDRFGAGEVAKRKDPERFSRLGFVCQAVAAGWHHKSPEQLGELGDKVGRERICIVHGTQDKMLVFKHAEMLLEDLGGEQRGVTKFFYEGQGHVIPIEKRKEFFDIIAGMCRKGQDENAKSGI